MIHPSADVDESAEIANSAKIWHLAQVRENAKIGERVVVGRGGYVGPGVEVGDDSKIQNFVQLHDPATLGKGVFVGPGAVLTNDVYPRSVDPSGSQKARDGWEATGVKLKDGVSVGAQAVVLAGVTVNEWALIGAGSVVIRDVPAHALMVGNPARRAGWVGYDGVQLKQQDGYWVSESSGDRFEETEEGLKKIDS